MSLQELYRLKRLSEDEVISPMKRDFVDNLHLSPT